MTQTAQDTARPPKTRQRHESGGQFPKSGQTGFAMRAAKRLMSRGCFAERIVQMNSSGWRGSVDKSHWDNSKELRDSVAEELDNWGTWSRDGGGCVVTSSSSVFKSGEGYRGVSEAYNVDKAERTEDILSEWWRTSQSGKVGVFLLKLKYVERRAREKIGFDYRRKFKSKRPDEVVQAMIDEAEWFYWLLTK